MSMILKTYPFDFDIALLPDPVIIIGKTVTGCSRTSFLLLKNHIQLSSGTTLSFVIKSSALPCFAMEDEGFAPSDGGGFEEAPASVDAIQEAAIEEPPYAHVEVSVQNESEPTVEVTCSFDLSSLS